jgi:predicted permease
VRAVLIVAEVAQAKTLTVGAGLLLRSFVRVLDVDPGFQADRLLTFQMTMPPRHQSAASRIAFYDELEARLAAIPGVTHVGGTTRLPLGSTNVTTYVEVEGTTLPESAWPEVEFRRAVFDYFGAMGIPVLRGRTFQREDQIGAAGAVVINATLAARAFPGEDPIGRRLRPTNSAWLTVIGVVGDIRHGSLEETPRPELYITYRQGPPVTPFLAVRTESDPAAVIPAVRAALRDLGADPPTDLRTMAEIRRASVGERRFVLLLVGVFGVLALALAGIGIYGVITLVAAERTAEVGIRLALGASPGAVLRLIVSDAVGLAILGVALGAGAALALAPAMASQLFGVAEADPPTYAGVAALLVAVAAVAALIPARRAMHIDPAGTLRR